MGDEQIAGGLCGPGACWVGGNTGEDHLVPPGKSVVPGHAAFRYSLMSPSHRLVRSNVMLAGGSSVGVGGRWLSDWWGRWVLWWAM